MKFDHTFNGTIEFLEYWHAGSGNPGHGDVDDTPVRDCDGLPYLPGRSLKGLFHEACCEMAALKAAMGFTVTSPMIESLFGNPGNDGWHHRGTLRFSNGAVLSSLRRYLVHKEMQEGLFEMMSATAIEESGVARARSLRRYEVATPVTLEFTISCDVHRVSHMTGEQVGQLLQTAASLIRRAGKFRNNGLGRCIVQVSTPA